MDDGEAEWTQCQEEGPTTIDRRVCGSMNSMRHDGWCDWTAERSGMSKITRGLHTWTPLDVTTLNGDSSGHRSDLGTEMAR